jgi:protein-tyrosine-phosphatase
MKKLIVFICNGNIHRSVIAAESLRKIFKEQKISRGFFVDSYGLQGTKGTNLPKHKHLSEYPKEWEAAKVTLQELGIDISKHSFQKISEAVMKKASVVIAMDNKVYSKAKNSLMNQFPNYAEKIHRFSELTMNHRDIKDPAGSSDVKLHREIILNIYSTLNKKFRNILDWIK